MSNMDSLITPRVQMIILVALLTTVGLSAVAYKHLVLGFPLVATQQENIWKIEAKIEFDAIGEEVTVNLNMLDENPARKTTFSKSVAPGYSFKVGTLNATKFAQWNIAKAEGSQTIYLREETFFTGQPTVAAQVSPLISKPRFEGALDEASQRLLAQIDPKASVDKTVLMVLDLVNDTQNDNVSLLLQNTKNNRSAKVGLAADLLRLQRIVARPSRGIMLDANRRKQTAQHFIEVYQDDHWQLYDPREVKAVAWERAIILQTNDEPLLEVYGGKNSRVYFSIQKESRAAFNAAVQAAKRERSALVDFSIYSLPIDEQNTFKLLLLLPLGALVVVILRNLVGIRTSGTFMPVLIALTFLQTNLLTGLTLFLVVVSVGLVIRSYLSHLNLLLVPRIASVLVFVIIIYAAIGIISHKLGLSWGSKITFFPMIILAWTIERMSILWDEDGPHEVLLQGAGSLLTASLAYVLMSNTLVADTIFLYPELLLVLLAFIISIGNYTGYRLSDLRRFDAMEKF